MNASDQQLMMMSHVLAKLLGTTPEALRKNLEGLPSALEAADSRLVENFQDILELAQKTRDEAQALHQKIEELRAELESNAKQIIHQSLELQAHMPAAARYLEGLSKPEIF